MGGPKCQEVLRNALAKGADKAIHIETTDAEVPMLEPLHVAKALQKIVEKEKFDVVFLGKQAIDDDAGQTPQLLAGLLEWPQALYASKVEKADDTHLQVSREIDGGMDVVKVEKADDTHLQVSREIDGGMDVVKVRIIFPYMISLNGFSLLKGIFAY
ncbi:unnamed protein product [Cylicostephanus goldi]|uniref:Electron transfer flavoprotein alpha/beta-subunit N-terminal domain-containing protein n=1 Tax=Cylicostephanus goldi TaxID=71465 RepID=A0A3P7NQG0_CYLGO|nr:unnamed protein product [Cylicostephanus goldi]